MFVISKRIKLGHGWRKRQRSDWGDQTAFADQRLMLKQLSLHLVECFVLG
jgi:hypothetical protein